MCNEVHHNSKTYSNMPYIQDEGGGLVCFNGGHAVLNIQGGRGVSKGDSSLKYQGGGGGGKGGCVNWEHAILNIKGGGGLCQRGIAVQNTKRQKGEGGLCQWGTCGTKYPGGGGGRGGLFQWRTCGTKYPGGVGGRAVKIRNMQY